jgi:DNA-binding response OmpR family regulator
VRILIVKQPGAVGNIEQAVRSIGFETERLVEHQATLNSLRGSRYDLLILDLPDCDSIGICRDVRAAGLSMPILVLASGTRVANRINALDAGADDYVCKPVGSREIGARVRALLRRTGGTGMHAIVVDDLTLDPLTKRVHRGRRRIELTGREFALLEYLMRHAGRPVSRTMIAEHVWGVRWHRRTNVIDVFISHLRTKVDPPTDRRLIHAVRGVGYLVGLRGQAVYDRPEWPRLRLVR